jgi:hypothetical protein
VRLSLAGLQDSKLILSEHDGRNSKGIGVHQLRRERRVAFGKGRRRSCPVSGAIFRLDLFEFLFDDPLDQSKVSLK